MIIILSRSDSCITVGNYLFFFLNLSSYFTTGIPSERRKKKDSYHLIRFLSLLLDRLYLIPI